MIDLIQLLNETKINNDYYSNNNKEGLHCKPRLKRGKKKNTILSVLERVKIKPSCQQRDQVVTLKMKINKHVYTER